jgi:hypothetical protein
MEYRDFDLHIERAAQGYRAQVLNSPAGQATADFVLPFSDLELENVLLRRRSGQRHVSAQKSGHEPDYSRLPRMADLGWGKDLRRCEKCCRGLWI